MAALLASGIATRADTVTVNGAQTFQTIAGIGANLNYMGWTNADLVPVLDALIDQAGMTVFRVNYKNSNWEATNDNSNPDVMNWSYYNQVYSSSNFARLWGLVAYLNQKGLTNGVMLSFHGYGPSWMLESNGYTLAPGMEDEWAEMIASALIYARTNRLLQLTLVGPDNEPEFTSEITGIVMNNSAQYVTALHYLAEKLDTNGLGDIRFVAPDMAFTVTSWWTNIMGDPVVMAKMAHFGLHTYEGGGTDGGQSDGIASFLQQSADPSADFWVTECSMGCVNCEGGGGPSGDLWQYGLSCAEYLLDQLANGATAALIFEGYDGFRLSGPNPNNYFLSTWGMFALNYSGGYPPPSPVTYTARPNFYTVAQISKFVRPGNQRIGVTTSFPFGPLQAFCQTNLLQLAIVGVNTSSSPDSLTVTLTNLPSIGSLELFYTDRTTNLCDAGPVPVVHNAFNVVAPASAIFTILNTNALISPPILGVSFASQTIVLSWQSPPGGYVLESATGLASPVAWSPVTNVPQTNGTQHSVVINPASNQKYFRLHQL